METINECDCCFEQFKNNNRPCVMTCGHTICYMCCRNILSSSKICPFCRMSITDYAINYKLDEFVQNQKDKFEIIIKKFRSEPNLNFLDPDTTQSEFLMELIVKLVGEKSSLLNKIWSDFKITENTILKSYNILTYILQYSEYNNLSEYLISHNYSSMNSGSWSSLMIAAKFGNHKMVDFLIKKGKNINKRNRKGRTAIMYAVKYFSNDNYKKIICELMNREVNLYIKDNTNQTVFDIAKKYKNNNKIFDLLKIKS